MYPIVRERNKKHSRTCTKSSSTMRNYQNQGWREKKKKNWRKTYETKHFANKFFPFSLVFSLFSFLSLSLFSFFHFPVPPPPLSLCFDSFSFSFSLCSLSLFLFKYPFSSSLRNVCAPM